MKILEFTFANDLSQFHDELLAAIPSLAPQIGEDGELWAITYVSGLGTSVTLKVPDETDEADIQSVIDSHVPKE